MRQKGPMGGGGYVLNALITNKEARQGKDEALSVIF
jgi:hypothetical protein